MPDVRLPVFRIIYQIIVEGNGELRQANVSYTPGAGEEAVTREEVNQELDSLLRYA